ncbi:hypothetical protein BpHYR1_028193 [Brachionus plicatilis]|uniref:Uncharacterized protein n=1 Tax=Brachionus plicatilis TaxID=10195 RepID=A0A3M7Q1G7_BRAPC|nr:hypothetical protein BpHYR1_028193 [Brachionus plicatilis]
MAIFSLKNRLKFFRKLIKDSISLFSTDLFKNYRFLLDCLEFLMNVFNLPYCSFTTNYKILAITIKTLSKIESPNKLAAEK